MNVNTSTNQRIFQGDELDYIKELSGEDDMVYRQFISLLGESLQECKECFATGISKRDYHMIGVQIHKMKTTFDLLNETEIQKILRSGMELIKRQDTQYEQQVMKLQSQLNGRCDYLIEALKVFL
ncbi:hypothetical protein V6R21_15230 [Limibacter armeniacum]|uniref:hypothetical protein n=1 Tax=Limibacter armeniacum TaxID=466084 RepID=UPI002FE646CD